MNRDDIMARYQQQIARIEGSKVYSAHAKRVLAAKAYTQHQAALEQVRQSELKAIEGRREQLQRKMFGRENAADAQTVIARRDANDRVAKLDNPRVAAEQLRDAIRQGDRTMAQALAQHAAGFGWSDVLEAYAEYQPGFRETAAAFNELPDTTPGSTWSIQHAFNHVVNPSSVLHDAQPHHIEQLAAQDLEAA